jgi:hypothetical protein
VDSEREARFNLTSSALNTFIITVHQSFQRMSLLVRLELVQGKTK